MKLPKFWTLASIVWMVSIFFFTQLPYFTGENTSEAIREVVATDHQPMKSTTDNSVDINRLNLVVRKATHIMVFGILAFLLFKSFESYRFANLISLLLTFLYAIADEWHQSFMPGRVPSFRDVLFDSFGALMALSVTFLLMKKRQPKKQR
jgi:VanZ family protein